MLELKFDPKKGVYAEETETLERLKKDFFGDIIDKKIYLSPEEVLYLVSFRNAVVLDGNGKEMDFHELSSCFIQNEPRLLIRFNAYRDWRDRGLIIRKYNPSVRGKHSKKTYKKYPSEKLKMEKLKTNAVWHADSMFSIVEDEATGRKIFEDYWFGQYGVYKQNRGIMNKLNFLETVFLSKHFGLNIIDAGTGKKIKYSDVLNHVLKKREYAGQLYDIYEDWRLKGYVVKTGFKFGSHFRIYFPGASPVKKGEWIHSRHVLHVFPKNQKLLISEWSRAVRVAHGVKKTFILGIPEMKEDDYIDFPVDFMAYRRKNNRLCFRRRTYRWCRTRIHVEEGKGIRSASSFVNNG